MILTSNNNDIADDAEIFTNGKPAISGYVDMLAAAGNDLEKDPEAYKDQIPPVYETEYSAVQSKKKAIRRVKFQDTDNNANDTEAIDYSEENIPDTTFPHSTAYGAWGDEYQMLMNEITRTLKAVPKFYGTYCIEESAEELTQALAALDAALSDDERDMDKLSSLKDAVLSAGDKLKFKHDDTVVQIYIATDKGNGESYGTRLTKSIGYVSAQIVCVSTDGSNMAYDMGAQVKVRGNYTSGGAKKPYNMKFSSKVDLFGFGKAKKWVLLADYYDPTLMRNWTALTLGKMLGLEATMDREHVEVWVDGQYRGFYLLTEKIEEDENRVDITSKNGDFLIEMDITSRIEAGNVYFSTAKGRFYRLREPEDEEKAKDVKATVDQLEDILASGEWDKVSTSIDIDSITSYYILNEFMKTQDFGGLSVFWHYKDGKLCGGPAWDFDFSSGSGGSVNPAGAFIATTHYYRYLFKMPEFWLEVFKKYKAFCDDSIFETIYSGDCLVDKEVSRYSEAIARNNALWNIANHDGQISYLKEWFVKRDKWLQDYYFNRIYEQSGDRYCYIDGELASGLVSYDNQYYYASADGKVTTGKLDIDGHSYYTDDTGKFLLQSINIELTGSNSITLAPGTSATLPITATVSGSYGHALTVPLSSGYSLTWSADTGSDGLTSSGNRVTAITPGTYHVTLTATATTSGFNGDIHAQAVANITVTVNELPADPEPEPEQDPEPAPAPKPEPELDAEPHEPESYASADMAITLEAPELSVTAGENVSCRISTDVSLKTSGNAYRWYIYSMDIANLPAWLEASGETASSDMIAPDSDGMSEYHHALTLSGIPTQPQEIIITLTAHAAISGDIAALEVSRSQDLKLSVKPAPEPEPEIEPSDDTEPEQEQQQQEHEPEAPVVTTNYVFDSSLNEISSMTDEQKQAIVKIAITGDVQDISMLSELVNLQEVDLTQAASLSVIDLSSNESIKSVDISGNGSVKSINLADSKIERFDASGCSGLEEVNISGCSELKQLNLSGTDILTLNAEDCAKLEILEAASCSLANLNLNGCKSLAVLRIDGNSLARFDAQDFTKLRELSCSGQVITGWAVGRTFNLGAYINDASVFASDNVSVSENISGVSAYDESGQEIATEYDSTTGDVTFSEAPYKITYDYATGFSNIAMDVSVFTDGTDTTYDNSVDTLDSPSGGCNAGFAAVVIAAALLFRKR